MTEEDLPLSIEPVVGWRAWRLSSVDGALRLVSLTRDDQWPPGEPMRAVCDGHGRVGVPNSSCTCGIYAADSAEHLATARVFTGAASVVGAIGMWGTVVEHTTGARSQFAYPARLRLVCGRCLHAGRGGVAPVRVFESGSTMHALCRRHAVGQIGTSRRAADVQQGLLSTYQVEAMPLDRVARPLRHPRVGPGLDPHPVMRSAVRAVFATIGFLFQAYIVLMLVLGAVTIAWAVVSNVVLNFMGDTASPAESVRPAPATIEHGADRVTSPELPAPKAFSDPPPRMAFVCGASAGALIRIVRCGSDHGGLVGFAQERPQGARSDCGPVWDAYSRGAHSSICWIVLIDGADVPRRPTSEDPFEPAA